MLKPSESVLTASAMGDVRAPLEGCWISQHTFPTPLVGPDPNDAMAAWRPDFDYTLGLKDPLLGRWRYNDRFSLLHVYVSLYYCMCPHMRDKDRLSLSRMSGTWQPCRRTSSISSIYLLY